MSATLTASGIARAHACPAAYALPSVQTPPSEHASAGSAMHAFLDALQTRTRDDALTTVPEEHRAWCAAIDPTRIPRGQPEIALAYDVFSGRARRLDVRAREYAVLETEIAGTCDLYVPAIGTDPARVIDWKTGTWSAATPESHRPQLALYALMLARAEGLDEIRAEVVSIGDDSSVRVVASWDYDLDTLAETAVSVRKTWARVQQARSASSVDVREGEHCRYCPAWNACPAKLAAVRAVLDDVSTLTPDAIGRAYVRAMDLERWAEAVRVAARDAAQGRSLPTGDGRVVVLDSRGRLQLKKAG
mgnify:CR=1 FL=1